MTAPTSPEMIGVHRALALVERSLKSAEEMRAVQLETGGAAPELVQGILDGIARLWARTIDRNLSGHFWVACHDAGPAHDPRSLRSCVCGNCGQGFIIRVNDLSPLPPCPSPRL